MSGEAGKWESIHRAVRNKLHLSQDRQYWSAGSQRELRGVPNSARMRDAIQISWGSRKPRQRSLPWMQDLSQCTSRRPWGPVIPCVTTSALIYDFSIDACMTSRDVLLAMGFPVRTMDLCNLSPVQLTDVAGEFIFLPNLAIIIVALYLNPLAPWWTKE